MSNQRYPEDMASSERPEEALSSQRRDSTCEDIASLMNPPRRDKKCE